MAGDAGGGGFAAFMDFVDKKETTEERDEAPPADEYHYEEAQEREAMMKSYHHPMKQWFRENPRLADKYGAYPLFWQELKTWAPYREVLKEFIKHTEGGRSGETTEAEDGNTSGDKAIAAAVHDTKKEEVKPAAADAQAASTDESQPRKRRKSRWGDPVDEAPAAAGDGEKRRKKSRWAPAGAPGGGVVNLLAQKQQQSVALRAKLDAINQRMTTVAVDAARIEKDPSRSPSPPPQYDANGKRTNTREVRMRAALEKSRQETIEQLVKINPLFRPPSDYQRQRLHRKIYIPVHDFPNYNFIGLIIGPRGNTQKRMEKETGCKIAIRGKGSVKEGSKGKKMNSDENDDLHVLITGDREDDIDRAAKEVQSLLVPVDDTKNSHKQKQLRELALINGTLRDDDFCHLCGEKGHRQWECPNRDQSFKSANVKCAICGDSSHPTRDCTQKRKSAAENAAIDKEYQSFMQQLGEKPVISSASTGSAAPAAPVAPWLQPAKTSSSALSQPWLTKSAGAPGTASAGAPGTAPAMAAPGTQAPAGQAAIGATPETAYPPPAGAYGGYAAQGWGAQAGQQEWGAAQQQDWNAAGYGAYYGGWDGSSVAGAPGAEYQQYSHYGPPAGTSGATNASGYAAPGSSDAQYQYSHYGNGANQQ